MTSSNTRCSRECRALIDNEVEVAVGILFDYIEGEFTAAFPDILCLDDVKDWAEFVVLDESVGVLVTRHEELQAYRSVPKLAVGFHHEGLFVAANVESISVLSEPGTIFPLWCHRDTFMCLIDGVKAQ